MQAVEIKNRFTGEVICTGETLKAAVEANLANLRDAHLRDANLGGANLGGANLRDAYLRGANLRDANLCDANLGGAYLGGANLRDANLGGAYLGGAYLRGANLRGANLRGANLRGANLRGANLRDANLRGGESRAKIAWQSHDLIAEILRRAAGDDAAKLKVAGFILVCRDKCWPDFLKMRDPLAGWALEVLRPWAEGDENAPMCLISKEPVQ